MVGQTISCYGNYWLDIQSDLTYLKSINTNGIYVTSKSKIIMENDIFTVAQVIDSPILSEKGLMCIDINTKYLDKICNNIKLGDNGVVYIKQ